MKSYALQIALIAIVTSVVTTVLIEQFRDSPRLRERSATAVLPLAAPAVSESRDEASAQLAEPGRSPTARDEALIELQERVAMLEQRLAQQMDVGTRRRPVETGQLPANREALRDFMLEVMTTDQEERTEAQLVAANDERRKNLARDIRMQARETEGVELFDYEVEAIVDIVIDIEQRRAELAASIGPETTDLEALERESDALEEEMRRRVEQYLGVQRTNALFGED